MFTDLTTDNYVGFLEYLREAGYAFRSFLDFDRCEGKSVVIRHDIDFDCHLAYEMALIEEKHQVQGTYFFLVSSDSYNIFSKQNSEYISKIKDLGHHVSIHFDPLVYEDFEAGFELERQLFEQKIGAEVKIISIHRPSPFFLEFDKPIHGVEHTYQSKYTVGLKYFADSTGVWRYGHPFNSTEFLEGKNLHILIHPVWWMQRDGLKDNLAKIRSQYFKKVGEVKKHFLENCKPFADIYDDLEP